MTKKVEKNSKFKWEKKKKKKTKQNEQTNNKKERGLTSYKREDPNDP
jgi:hypothetical protein